MSLKGRINSHFDPKKVHALESGKYLASKNRQQAFVSIRYINFCKCFNRLKYSFWNVLPENEIEMNSPVKVIENKQLSRTKKTAKTKADVSSDEEEEDAISDEHSEEEHKLSDQEVEQMAQSSGKIAQKIHYLSETALQEMQERLLKNRDTISLDLEESIKGKVDQVLEIKKQRKQNEKKVSTSLQLVTVASSKPGKLSKSMTVGVLNTPRSKTNSSPPHKLGTSDLRDSTQYHSKEYYYFQVKVFRETQHENSIYTLKITQDNDPHKVFSLDNLSADEENYLIFDEPNIIDFDPVSKLPWISGRAIDLLGKSIKIEVHSKYPVKTRVAENRLVFHRLEEMQLNTQTSPQQSSPQMTKERPKHLNLVYQKRDSMPNVKLNANNSSPETQQILKILKIQEGNEELFDI